MRVTEQQYQKLLCPLPAQPSPRLKQRMRKAAAPSESNILNACLRWLYAHGLQPIRNNTGAFSKKYLSKKTGMEVNHYVRVGKKGSGDILVCGAGGRWIEIEAKRQDGRQEEAQIERQRHVEAMGGVYILARSVEALEARKEEIMGGNKWLR